MFDINDLLDYVQDDCVFDIFECDSTAFDCVIAKKLSRDELEDWLERHTCDLCSFEPIQRKDERGDTIFGIVWNVENVEDIE